MDTRASNPDNAEMPDDGVSRAAVELKRLRERAGLSVRELADKLKVSPSSYAYYENEFKKPLLPLQLARAIAGVLSPYGIDAQDVMVLAGLDESDAQFSRKKPRDGLVAVDASYVSLTLEELDVRVSAGPGTMVEGEGVVGQWRVPQTLVRVASNSNQEAIKILTVVGDSMPASFRPYDKVMVDTKDTRPQPPGIFVVWEGMGLVVKRVMMIPHSDPPTVRIMSENPAYPSYERTLEEAYIQGRVLGKWLWI